MFRKESAGVSLVLIVAALLCVAMLHTLGCSQAPEKNTQVSVDTGQSETSVETSPPDVTDETEEEIESSELADEDEFAGVDAAPNGPSSTRTP